MVRPERESKIMANTTPAKYTVQLGPTVTPEMAAELATWAELLGVSNSVVTRDSIEHGLVVLRTLWRAQVLEKLPRRTNFDSVWAATYKPHLQHFEGRGTRQTTRRRNYDAETRGAGTRRSRDLGAVSVTPSVQA